MKTSLRVLALALAASVLGTAAAAHAQTATVITSLPYVINSGGLYVLGGNLNSAQTSGYLIEIRANNVTLDFQNYYISGAVNNTTQTTTGVYATEKSNITLKNGTIAFCNSAIVLDGNGTANTNAVDERVENMRITYCYRIGVRIGRCPSSRVVDCQVSQIGYAGGPSAYGITSDGALVQNNFVNSILSQGGVGIYLKGGSGNTSAFAIRNTIANCAYGIYGDTGNYAPKYQDNLTVNCTTPFTGAVDAGGNN